MLSVTLIQWCEEERLEIPTSRIERPSLPSAPVFDIDAAPAESEELSLPESPLTDLIIGKTRIDADNIDNAIAHMVCYVDSGARKSNYPKSEACGLPGHSIDKCSPLINSVIAQALAAQHPEVVCKIKTAYKQFPRNVRSHTPRKSTIKQSVTFWTSLPRRTCIFLLNRTTRHYPIFSQALISTTQIYSTAKWAPHSSRIEIKHGSRPLRNHQDILIIRHI
jgi:hypothetical protein